MAARGWMGSGWSLALAQAAARLRLGSVDPERWMEIQWTESKGRGSPGFRRRRMAGGESWMRAGVLGGLRRRRSRRRVRLDAVDLLVVAACPGAACRGGGALVRGGRWRRREERRWRSSRRRRSGLGLRKGAHGREALLLSTLVEEGPRGGAISGGGCGRRGRETSRWRHGLRQRWGQAVSWRGRRGLGCVCGLLGFGPLAFSFLPLFFCSDFFSFSFSVLFL